MFVRDWMSKNPVTIQCGDSLLHAKALMQRYRIRRLPVLDGTRLVGILTDRDLRDNTPSHCTTLDVHELHSLIDKITVGDAMTRGPITVTPDTPIEEAARLMLTHKVGGFPVVEGGRVAGVITESDIFRMLVRRLDEEAPARAA
jgi:CBS domain-containing protein